MNRRTLLAGLPLLAISACAKGTSPDTVTAQTVADVGLVSAGADAILAAAATVPGIPAATLAEISAAVTEVKAAALQVTPSVSVAVAQPSVSTIESAVNGILGALAGFPLGAGLTGILQAVTVLLPVVEAAVGIVVAAAASPRMMTVAQARITLARR